MVEECGLSRESSETIGFVLSSLFCSAIDLKELRDWCYLIIDQLDTEKTPAYLYDLAEYNGTLAKIDAVLGFVPTWKHTDEDEDALFGIAAARGFDAFDWPIEREVALTALAARPQVADRFRRTFPFITLPEKP